MEIKKLKTHLNLFSIKEMGEFIKAWRIQ